MRALLLSSVLGFAALGLLFASPDLAQARGYRGGSWGGGRAYYGGGWGGGRAYYGGGWYGGRGYYGGGYWYPGFGIGLGLGYNSYYYPGTTYYAPSTSYYYTPDTGYDSYYYSPDSGATIYSTPSYYYGQ